MLEGSTVMVANPHVRFGQLLHNAVPVFANMLKNSNPLWNFRRFLRLTLQINGQNMVREVTGSVIVLVAMAVMMVMGVIVSLVLAMIMAMILSMTMTMTMTVAVAVAVAMVGFVLMGRGPVPVMGHSRPHVGLLDGRRLGIPPATAFEVKIGCREQFLQLGLTAFRAIRQGISADFLQGVEVISAGLALVVKNGHGAGPEQLGPWMLLEAPDETQ